MDVPIQDKFRIDFGNIITIGVLLVSGGVAWGNLNSIKERQVESIQEIRSIGDHVTSMREKQVEMDSRLKNVELQIDRITRKEARE